MASSDFNFEHYEDERVGHDGEPHPSQIERPGTPSPYSSEDNGRLFSYTSIPYSEMEPLDQMIFDLEVAKFSQLATAPEAGEHAGNDDLFRSYKPYSDMDPLDEAILDLEADQNSHLAMIKAEADVVSAEFYRRQWLANEDRNIHHYNWFGTAIYRPSSTPPEQSLAIIMAKPRVTSFDRNLRNHTVLNQANLYLDPVIINFGTPDNSVLINQLLRRHNLEDTMKGHVVKYYTPHGLWMSETRSTDDNIQVDDGCVANYITNYAVGNGFISQSYITSWKQWKANYNKVRATERKPTRGRKKKAQVPRLSPLRQVMTAEAEDVPSIYSDTDSRIVRRHSESSSTDVSMIVNRKSWPSKTANRHWVLRNDRITRGDVDWLEAEDPNSYYSLPFPEPVRLGQGVGGTIRRASRNALPYFICRPRS